MDCSDSLKGGFKLAVLTRVRSLWTLLALVESNAATLEKFSTPMPSLYLHKLTPTQLAPWRRIFIQVLLIFPQFPPPLTTIFYVGAPNIKFFQRPFQLVVPHEGEVRFVTQRARFFVPLYTLHALATDLLSAGTADDARLSQDLKTNRTLGLKSGWRRFNKLTIKPAAVVPRTRTRFQSSHDDHARVPRPARPGIRIPIRHYRPGSGW